MDDKPTPQLRPLLTPREVASACGIGLRTVYRMIATQQIPAGKLGDRYRIPITFVTDFMNPDYQYNLANPPVPNPGPRRKPKSPDA